MADNDYEYRGLMAEFWDLFRGDTSGWSDRALFFDLVQTYGQPVLDVGCGTGRLLLDFLAKGIDIDGVDNSPEMLALCRQKAQALDLQELGLQPTIYHQDMTALDLPRRYQTILVPSSSFQLLLEPAQATAAMNRFYDHLLPGGVLIMPFMILATSADEINPNPEWELSRETVRPADNALIRRWSRNTLDLANQLESTADRYEILINGQIVASEEHHRSPATRWYTQSQAIQLYQDAGFHPIHLLKEFTHEPAGPDDTLFTIIGHKPNP